MFWYDQLDGIVNDYPYERVLEVFVRVNNGGTKLDGGDLMFAAMKGLSGDIEEQVGGDRRPAVHRGPRLRQGVGAEGHRRRVDRQCNPRAPALRGHERRCPDEAHRR